MSPKIPNLKQRESNFKVDSKSGIISSAIFGDPTAVETLVAVVDLKKFYNELHDTLVFNRTVRFVDMLTSNQNKGQFLGGVHKLGEHVDNGELLNRSGDMFETQFVWAKNDGGAEELEMNWMARAKTAFSEYGWVEFKINLVCRRIINKEVLIGNNKKTMQDGTWEFRNRITYKNSIIPNFLHKVPFVKDSSLLQQLYLDHVYFDNLQRDVEFVIEKIKPIVYNVIDKHFK